MVLSDEGIRNALAAGEIEIEPAPIADQYSTSAVDIFLGGAETFRAWNLKKFKIPGVEVTLDLSQQKYPLTAQEYSIPVETDKNGCVILPPYAVEPQVMLCQTRERIHLKHESRIAARVEGRSSLARLGLMVHLTAPTIHSGFNATITLEMMNHGPFYLKLVPHKTPICQFIFERLETPAGMKINTDFQGQTNPLGKVGI